MIGQSKRVDAAGRVRRRHRWFDYALVIVLGVVTGARLAIAFIGSQPAGAQTGEVQGDGFSVTGGYDGFTWYVDDDSDEDDDGYGFQLCVSADGQSNCGVMSIGNH